MRHLARRCRRAGAAAVVLAATTACGGLASSPASHSPPASFPLTISRTGGIAGFSDVLVVTEGGQVSFTRKGRATRRCQLTPGAVERVTTAASQVPWSRITPGRTRPSFPDDLVTAVQSPAGGPVRLDDQQAGKGRLALTGLLDDLSDPATAARVCPPL